jgi:hypothetical protein
VLRSPAANSHPAAASAIYLFLPRKGKLEPFILLPLLREVWTCGDVFSEEPSRSRRRQW